ncbi:unnamed protein product [Orchesella dallaii]|uniref:Uncharacterized protein n=1 Tax=Orchesella dallaii TaxID=48710 RepID=A0ABP1RPK0_9HEXA
MYGIAFLSGILFGMSYKANLTVTKLQTLWKENDKEIEKIQNFTDLVERGYTFASDTTQMFDLHPEDFEKAGLKNLTSFKWFKLSASSEKDYRKFKKRIIEGEKVSIPIVTERYWVIETIHWLQGSGLLQYWNKDAGKGVKTRREDDVLVSKRFVFELNLIKIGMGIVGIMFVITTIVFLTEMVFCIFQLIAHAFGKPEKVVRLRKSEAQVVLGSSDKVENS